MRDFVATDPHMDSILFDHKNELGAHYNKYRNHVYRVFNLTLLLSVPRENDIKALAMAAAFHDLGIWTAHTFDYLAPSVELSRNYLAKNNLSAIEQLVTDIINNHHKLSGYKPNSMVEAFRKADLIDLSFGLVSFGIKTKQIRELNAQFPSLGFHRFILFQAIKNMLRHPLNPLPMMRL